MLNCYQTVYTMMDTTNFFRSFFENAKNNAVILMDNEGLIMTTNQAFKTAFGYHEEDLKGKHLRILFNEEDRLKKMPEREVMNTITEGSSNDNNYLMHKEGFAIWVTGESVKVKNDDGHPYIVKVVHNIHAQKILERFLLESNVFLDSIFQSVRNTPMLVINSMMKIVKINDFFFEFFQLKNEELEGKKLSDIKHPFWNSGDVASMLRQVIVTNDYPMVQHFNWTTIKGEAKKLCLTTKLIDGHMGMDKKILLVIDDATKEEG